MQLRSETAAAVLSALADQAEQEGRRRVCRVRLTRDRYPAYFDDATSTHRQSAHADLQALEAAGVVVLGWQRWERGNWLAHVDLRTGSETMLFDLLGRRPRIERAAALQGVLAAFEPGQEPAPEWVRACMDWGASRIAEGRKPLPLDWDDLAEARDMLLALSAIASLAEPMLERTLSTRVFGDSKRFEAIRPKVVRLLAQFLPGADAVSEGDLLRSLGVDRAPEYVPVAGPIAVEPGRVDLGQIPFSVALPAPVLREATLRHSGGTATVTIENETSFAQWLEVRPSDTIAVFTGGFPSRAVLRLVRELGLPVFHWGDLDAGGLEILAYMRRTVGTVTPLAMGRAELATHRASCRELTPGDRKRLEQLGGLPELHDLRFVIDAMLREGRKLEQEIVPPGVAAAALEALLLDRGVRSG